MTIIKTKRSAIFTIYLTLGLLPVVSFAASKPITTQDLFTNVSPTEPWHKGRLTATKTVNFQQSASGGTDATTVAKVQLGYFTSADCTGSLVGTGFYISPDGTSYTISVGTAFGLVATSTWNVGTTQLGIADMTTINSVAVTLKSTNNNVPQGNFSNLSFACVPVTCATNACTSVAGTQSFELKTTAAVGDPADGGLIGCFDTGAEPNSFNLIVPAANNSELIEWEASSESDPINATSTSDGAGNTASIVNCLTNGLDGCAGGQDVNAYAAGICTVYSAAGGYTSGWFLPSGGNVTDTQINCIYDNRVALGIGSSGVYWTSTEDSFGASSARIKNFATGGQINRLKSSQNIVRCARAFTP